MIDYRIGDTRDLTAALPDGSMHLVATSPPFLALRSYLPADHEHKHAEIGSEPDPATFLDTLLALTAEWGRVLAPWGSIAIELGDTYSGSGGAGGDYSIGGLRDGQQKFDGSGRRGDGRTGGKGGLPTIPTRAGAAGYTVDKGAAGWPRAKSLALIPQLYATSLAYGRNLLTGQPSPAGQWLVRNMVVWHRPNPAVGALGDKYRPSTSYITVATRSPKRWFDLSAVRTPVTAAEWRKAGQCSGESYGGGDGGWKAGRERRPDPAGAPPLDCWFDHDSHDTWTVTTQPSRLAHYAMWPPKLAERLILSMCPEWVCAECGEPRRRIESNVRFLSDGTIASTDFIGGDRLSGINQQNAILKGWSHNERATLGWTDCGHNDYQPGVVLDPFAGTGTTLCVADLHHRTGIGFDLDPRNADLVRPRMDEVRRALFGTTPELPGQLGMFEEGAA